MLLTEPTRVIYFVYQTAYPLANQENIVKNRETIMKKLLAGIKPLFRIVNTLNPQVKKTKE
jgi:hypothetical protein